MKQNDIYSPFKYLTTSKLYMHAEIRRSKRDAEL